jgi:hypothetical protein
MRIWMERIKLRSVFEREDTFCKGGDQPQKGLFAAVLFLKEGELSSVRPPPCSFSLSKQCDASSIGDAMSANDQSCQFSSRAAR